MQALLSASGGDPSMAEMGPRDSYNLAVDFIAENEKDEGGGYPIFHFPKYGGYNYTFC